MMRLLEIIASTDPVTGGPIEGMLRQADVTHQLCQREVLSLDPEGAPHLQEFPLKVHAMGLEHPLPGPFGRYGYSPRFIPWLRDNAEGYDAIIVNGLWNYASFAASKVLPHKKTPYFVFTHGMMDPWFRKVHPVKHMAKQLFWLVGEGRLMASARVALFTTEEERLVAHGVFSGHRYREEVVGYGTAKPPPPSIAQDLAFQSAVPTLQGRPYLLYLSRIHPKKGCDLLIEALARVAPQIPANMQLVIAGPDQAGAAHKLRRLANDLGVGDRIHWPGMLQGDAKWGAFNNAEAFVLPSHQENFGIVVAEAMGCGRPVLISDKVNIWREVEASGGGVVEPDTIDGTEALLRRWFDLTPEARADMGRRAAAAFGQHFDVAQTAPYLIETLKRLS